MAIVSNILLPSSLTAGNKLLGHKCDIPFITVCITSLALARIVCIRPAFSAASIAALPPVSAALAVSFITFVAFLAAFAAVSKVSYVLYNVLLTGLKSLIDVGILDATLSETAPNAFLIAFPAFFVFSKEAIVFTTALPASTPVLAIQAP